MSQDAEHCSEIASEESLFQLTAGVNEPKEYIENARRVGVAEHRIAFLKGVAALYTGEPRTATEELKKALDAEPDSVAANTMLAMSYHYSGRIMDGVVHRDKAVALVPREKKSRDYLFLAHAKMVESEEGLLDIASFWAEHKSPLGLAVRAPRLDDF